MNLCMRCGRAAAVGLRRCFSRQNGERQCGDYGRLGHWLRDPVIVAEQSR